MDITSIEPVLLLHPVLLPLWLGAKSGIEFFHNFEMKEFIHGAQFTMKEKLNTPWAMYVFLGSLMGLWASLLLTARWWYWSTKWISRREPVMSKERKQEILSDELTNFVEDLRYRNVIKTAREKVQLYRKLAEVLNLPDLRPRKQRLSKTDQDVLKSVITERLKKQGKDPTAIINSPKKKLEMIKARRLLRRAA